jgi:hypothetical protein
MCPLFAPLSYFLILSNSDTNGRVYPLYVCDGVKRCMDKHHRNHEPRQLRLIAMTFSNFSQTRTSPLTIQTNCKDADNKPCKLLCGRQQVNKSVENVLWIIAFLQGHQPVCVDPKCASCRITQTCKFVREYPFYQHQGSRAHTIIVSVRGHSLRCPLINALLTLLPL